MLNVLKNEKTASILLVALLVLTLVEHQILECTLFNTLALFVIFAIIMYSGESVAHHDEMLAEIWRPFAKYQLAW